MAETKWKNYHFRRATLDDLRSIVEMSKEAHEESRFGHIEFSAEAVQKIATLAIKDGARHGVIICEYRMEPVGFAYCSVGPYHIGTGALICTIHNINVARSVRAKLAGGRAAIGLFRSVEQWAEARGADELLLHVSSGLDLARSHKLTKRLGYRLIGGSYAKRLVP